MKVIICNLKRIVRPSIRVLNSGSFYEWDNVNNNQECFEKILNVARYEDYTLHLLMKLTTVRSNWYSDIYQDDESSHMINIAFPIEDIENEIRNNYIIHQIIGDIVRYIPLPTLINLLEPLLKYIEKNYKYLGDVFDKDIDILSNRMKAKRIIILTNQNKYIGHIYHTGTRNLSVYVHH